jgi:putative acetyltransferase
MFMRSSGAGVQGATRRALAQLAPQQVEPSAVQRDTTQGGAAWQAPETLHSVPGRQSGPLAPQRSPAPVSAPGVPAATQRPVAKSQTSVPPHGVARGSPQSAVHVPLAQLSPAGHVHGVSARASMVGGVSIGVTQRPSTQLCPPAQSELERQPLGAGGSQAAATIATQSTTANREVMALSYHWRPAAVLARPETRYHGLMERTALVLRLARVEDAPLLAAAERAIAQVPGQLVSRPDELVDERFAQKIAALAVAENGRYLVAEIEGTIVGHGLLDPLPLAAVRHVVHLTLAVHPGWQGRGVGRALLEALIAWARTAPAVGKIELHVRAPNERARALYRSLGFAEVGRWRHRVQIGPGQYVDDVAMDLLVK